MVEANVEPGALGATWPGYGCTPMPSIEEASAGSARKARAKKRPGCSSRLGLNPVPEPGATPPLTTGIDESAARTARAAETTSPAHRPGFGGPFQKLAKLGSFQ